MFHATLNRQSNQPFGCLVVQLLKRFHVVGTIAELMSQPSGVNDFANTIVQVIGNRIRAQIRGHRTSQQIIAVAGRRAAFQAPRGQGALDRQLRQLPQDRAAQKATRTGQ